MAMLKNADSTVVHPGSGLTAEQGLNRWRHVRKASRKTGGVSANLVEQAASIFDKPFKPSDYLLTHATIVASVDVTEPTGVKLGSVLEDGFRVNRKFGDYRIKPACDRFINSNLDAWSREVLLKSYPTFIGGHNFLEHIQVEEQSKGRIIDAVARDIGDSVYIDILIATERKHAELVKAIESGKMSTMSMGCTVDGTICTKCGHWAADETEMCPHVKYEKGNVFYDSQGRKNRVAELCGHSSISPRGGVQFIEASWVSTPAFTGAVLRNVLEPTAETHRKAQRILSSPPPQWSGGARRKSAFGTLSRGPLCASQWDDEEEEGGQDEGEALPPLKKYEDELYNHMLNHIKTRIQKDMETDEPKAPGPNEDTSMNETLVKEGSFQVYAASLNMLVRTSNSDVHLLSRVASLNQAFGIEVPQEVYRVVLKTGGTYRYANLQQFLGACQSALGRQPTLAEARTFVRLGKIISQRGKKAKRSSDFWGKNNSGSSQGE